MSRGANFPDHFFLAGLTAPVFSVSLAAWILLLDSVLNAYMDASLRAITGGKYYPEGWS